MEEYRKFAIWPLELRKYTVKISGVLFVVIMSLFFRRFLSFLFEYLFKFLEKINSIQNSLENGDWLFRVFDAAT